MQKTDYLPEIKLKNVCPGCGRLLLPSRVKIHPQKAAFLSHTLSGLLISGVNSLD